MNHFTNWFTQEKYELSSLPFFFAIYRAVNFNPSETVQQIMRLNKQIALAFDSANYKQTVEDVGKIFGDMYLAYSILSCCTR